MFLGSCWKSNPVSFWYFGMFVFFHWPDTFTAECIRFDVSSALCIKEVYCSFMGVFQWNSHEANLLGNLWIIQSVKLGQSIKSSEQIFCLQDIYNKLFVQPPGKMGQFFVCLTYILDWLCLMLKYMMKKLPPAVKAEWGACFRCSCYSRFCSLHDTKCN